MPSPSPSPSPSAAESSSSLFFLGGAVGAGTGVADGLPGPAVGVGTGTADGAIVIVGAGVGVVEGAAVVGVGVGAGVGENVSVVTPVTVASDKLRRRAHERRRRLASFTIAVVITSSPESVSYSAQVTPDMPTATATMGTRVGAGVGVPVGTGIGTAVGVYKQTKPMQLPPVKQSLSTAQTSLRPQGGQLSPPQSTSVSPIAVSKAPFVHSASVGAGVGTNVGSGVGAGTGTADGMQCIDTKYSRISISQSDAHPAYESVAVLSKPDIEVASSQVVGSEGQAAPQSYE